MYCAEPVHKLSGIGTGKRCVIIGGGESKNHFDIAHLDYSFDIISCNLHGIDRCRMMIFHDKEIADAIPRIQILPEYIIGSKQNVTLGCTHEYLASDITTGADVDFGDTGYHALQMADRIFNYSEIYLVGFDYITGEYSYHWDELMSNERKLSDFRKHSIGVVLPKFKAYQPKNKVRLSSLPSALNYQFERIDNL
jgi:hypothetical protein